MQAHLRQAVPEAVHEIWLEPLRPRDLSGTTLVVEAPDAHVRWLADRFARVLQTCAAAVLGPEASVDVVAASSPPRRGENTRSRPAKAGKETAVAGGALHPDHTFDQFVIGEGNRLAHAAALAVAEQPGQAYNPLFLYGPPGVGKTHLLHSIAHYVQAHGSGLTVRYTTIEAFTNAFVTAVRGGDVDRFKNRYRGTDVLLIDDVQFLADKTRTEEEFFHTFNALYDTGGQLVLTSDRLPRDMEALEDRLLERFESGLVADITAPDLSTRLTILRLRAQRDRLPDIDPRALEVIADRVADNVRALEGALIRVVAYHSLRHPASRSRRRWSPTSSTSSIPTRARRGGPRSATSRTSPARPSASPTTNSSLPAASPGSPGRASSPCICLANSPTPRSRPSVGSSAAATMPPSSTPSARRASASPRTRALEKSPALSPPAPTTPVATGPTETLVHPDPTPRCPQPPHLHRTFPHPNSPMTITLPHLVP